jgi:hypothetical protein
MKDLLRASRRAIELEKDNFEDMVGEKGIHDFVLNCFDEYKSLLNRQGLEEVADEFDKLEEFITELVYLVALEGKGIVERYKL